MVRLGKAIKGKVKTESEHKRVMVKIRNQDKTMEEMGSDNWSKSTSHITINHANNSAGLHRLYFGFIILCSICANQYV